MGKLIHPHEDAGSGVRFKAFLSRLGSRYSTVERQLWGLRNGLDHNAMNVACYMSKLDESRAAHLEVEHDLIFVHTRELLRDFEAAVDRLEEEFRSDAGLLARADSRLTYGILNNPSWVSQYQNTPAPGPRFVRER